MTDLMLNSITLSQQGYMNLQVSGSYETSNSAKIKRSSLFTSLRVAAVLGGVDTSEVQLWTDDLSFAGLRATVDWRLVISQRTVHLTVTPVPGGDAVLFVLTLTLVLPGLTVPTSRLYQHLQDVLDLLAGAGLVSGPALVVTGVGLDHGRDDQGGAPEATDLFKPVKNKC